MVHRLKYRDKREIAITMAAMMADAVYKNAISYDFIVPVPSYKKKERKRGYNQAELIARELSNITGKPVINAVIRVKDTKPQVLFDESARWYNVMDAFECSMDLKGMHILLVDDVITTGATANFCAKALKDCGAVYVAVLSFSKSAL